jgi:hypothetical protein
LVLKVQQGLLDMNFMLTDGKNDNNKDEPEHCRCSKNTGKRVIFPPQLSLLIYTQHLWPTG